MAKAKVIDGYICRSKNSDRVMICIGSTPPSQKKKNGWFWYVPGWFYTLSVWKLKKMFGFSIRPGTYEPISISIIRKNKVEVKK